MLATFRARTARLKKRGRAYDQQEIADGAVRIEVVRPCKAAAQPSARRPRSQRTCRRAVRAQAIKLN